MDPPCCPALIPASCHSLTPLCHDPSVIYVLVFFSLPHRSGGVTTVTLVALAAASGVFAAGVGFVVGYKSSPSFAYMRIPSLV